MEYTLLNKKKSYIWLIVAAILLPFSNGRWVVPLLAWIAPVFLIRFYRVNKNIKGIMLPLLVLIFAYCFSFKGVPDIGGWTEYAVIAGLSVTFYLPFLVDRFIGVKIQGFKSTIVLPLAGVTSEYILSLVSPYGTWGGFWLYSIWKFTFNAVGFCYWRFGDKLYIILVLLLC